jgi:hypothetical protein
MSSRGHYRSAAVFLDPADQKVKVIPNATITVFAGGTTTPIDPAKLFAGETGATTLPNPFTADASGNVEFWYEPGARASAALRLDVKAQGAGIYAGYGPITLAREDVIGGGMLESIDEPFDAFASGAYYGGEGYNFTKIGLAEGTVASPTTTRDPMVRLFRRARPTAANSNANVVGLLDLYTSIEGTIVDGAGATGSAWNFQNLVSQVVDSGTGANHTSIGLILSVVAQSAQAAVNGANFLVSFGARGGDVVELDLINDAGRAIGGALSGWSTAHWADTLPSADGSTALAIGAFARGATQLDEILIAGGAGTFTITVNTGTGGAQTTAALAWNAATATVQAALEALSNIGVGDITVTGTPGSIYNLIWGGALVYTPLTVSQVGTGGCTATKFTVTQGNGSRYHEQLTLFLGTGAIAGARAGLRPMPQAILDDHYFLYLPGLSGVAGGNARTMLSQNASPLWWLSADHLSELAAVKVDGSNRTALMSDAAVIMQNVAGSLVYGLFNTSGLTIANYGINLGSATGAGTGDVKGSGSATFSTGVNVGSASGAAAGEIKTSAAIKAGGTIYPSNQVLWGLDNVTNASVAAGASVDLGVRTGLMTFYDSGSGHLVTVQVSGGVVSLIQVATTSGTIWNVGADAGTTWAVFLSVANLIVKNRTGSARGFVAMRLGT